MKERRLGGVGRKALIRGYPKIEWNSKAKKLSLCQFSRYLVFIQIMKIRHQIGFICFKNTGLESIFICKTIFIFIMHFSSGLWKTFL